MIQLEWKEMKTLKNKADPANRIEFRSPLGSFHFCDRRVQTET